MLLAQRGRERERILLLLTKAAMEMAVKMQSSRQQHTIIRETHMLTSCRIVPELRNQLTFLVQLLKVVLLYQCAMLTGFAEDIYISRKANKNLPMGFSFFTEFFSKTHYNIFSSELFILFLKLQFNYCSSSFSEIVD